MKFFIDASEELDYDDHAEDWPLTLKIIQNQFYTHFLTLNQKKAVEQAEIKN